jgi:uncharacterized protein YllA (UPF0747 family)
MAFLAIDGSKFKAVNARDKNFTRASIKRRMEQVPTDLIEKVGSRCLWRIDCVLMGRQDM